MATEKILQTRILNKIDTLENWNKSSLKIKQGEICLATVAASAGTGLTEPVVMAKIGTVEEKTFAELPWSFYAKASDVLAACKDETALKTFINGVIADAGVATDDALKTLSEQVTTNKNDIATLNGDVSTAGSVAKAIKDAIDALNLADTYAAKTHGHEIGEVNGLADAISAAKKSGDDAMDEAQKKVASVTAGDASVTVGGTATSPTVAAKLSADADNALTLVDDGLKVVIPAAAEYSIVKAADSGEYAAVYNLTKDGAVVGASINIPKDIVVKSGSVVGDEIVLVLNDEAATEIKIPVASLIEYVTSGSQTGDMIVVNVSDDHKVTATITDGTVTLAKLATEVQTAIGKAHTHENATVLDAINADKVAAWDAAEANAIAKANELNGAMNTRVEALEAIDHDHANKTELDLIASGDKAKWDAKLEDVTATADSGLKATKTGNTVAVEIDDSVTWVFDCGGSGVTAAE